MKQELHYINTSDKIKIALWKLLPSQSNNQNIFLTHGTFSNRKICDGIANYFVELGYTCWIMEWRNHGKSSKSERNFNFETIAKYDIKSTFNFLFVDQKIKNIHCITHSGGGIILTMALINNPEFCSTIKSITFFGVQAFSAGNTTGNRLKIVIGKYISKLLGKIPAKFVGSTEHDEKYYLMKQWFNWNLSGNFKGENKFDYKLRISKIKTPILSICAKGDNFIAPDYACKLFLSEFKNPENKLVYLSKQTGNLEDYNHSRILKSKHAQKEVWPLVVNWIKNHN